MFAIEVCTIQALPHKIVGHKVGYAVTVGGQSYADTRTILTPLLTPLSAQYTATAGNRKQRIGLYKPLLQRTAARGNRCRRIVVPNLPRLSAWERGVSRAAKRHLPVYVAELPAGPQHCHPRARVPVQRRSEVSQSGVPSRLMGCR
jgi:hypothetical protein